jgi:hypothetical protein
MSLMRFNVFEGVRPRGEVSKRVEAEIADVRLLGGDEPCEEDRSGANKRRAGIQVDGKADRFKKNGSLSVIMLHVSRLFSTVVHDCLKDLKQGGPDGRII